MFENVYLQPLKKLKAFNKNSVVMDDRRPLVSVLLYSTVFFRQKTEFIATVFSYVFLGFFYFAEKVIHIWHFLIMAGIFVCFLN